MAAEDQITNAEQKGLIRKFTQRTLDLFHSLNVIQQNFNSLYSRVMHNERITTEICGRAVKRIEEVEHDMLHNTEQHVETARLLALATERLELAERQLSKLNYFLPANERESFYEVPESGLLKNIFGRGK